MRLKERLLLDQSLVDTLSFQHESLNLHNSIQSTDIIAAQHLAD